MGAVFFTTGIILFSGNGNITFPVMSQEILEALCFCSMEDDTDTDCVFCKGSGKIEISVNIESDEGSSFWIAFCEICGCQNGYYIKDIKTHKFIDSPPKIKHICLNKECENDYCSWQRVD